jgi:hypothetical protein
MKQFDVHFIVKLSDFVGSIDAKNKSQARLTALNIINDSGFLEQLIVSLTQDFDNGLLDLKLTEVLEVGKDI